MVEERVLVQVLNWQHWNIVIALIFFVHIVVSAHLSLLLDELRFLSRERFRSRVSVIECARANALAIICFKYVGWSIIGSTVDLHILFFGFAKLFNKWCGTLRKKKMFNTNWRGKPLESKRTTKRYFLVKF